MTISYVITCDIAINSIHKYISRSGNANIVCVMSCCVLKMNCNVCIVCKNGKLQQRKKKFWLFDWSH